MTNNLFTMVNKHGARTVVYIDGRGFLRAANGAHIGNVSAEKILSDFCNNGGRVDNSPHPSGCHCNIHDGDS